MLAVITGASACASRGSGADLVPPSPAAIDAAAPARGTTSNADPRLGEVPLPCADGWEARLVLENGDVGIWTVEAFDVFRQYAVPEVVGLDDLGRCHVVVSYSGKWTPNTRVHDGKWLGGLAHGDVDPRVPGTELYTGGQSGNLYQLVAYPHGALDARLIAHLPGRELHTIVAGELDPSNATPELLVFTHPGELYRVAPTGGDGRFETELLCELPGRVRDAVVLQGKDGGTPEIATVSRDGVLAILRLEEGRVVRKEVHREPMGMGRIALRRGGEDPLVLYVTLDDGRVQRHERRGDSWTTETIHAGAQGARGVVSGRFTADPDEETIAVFGYSAEVELLSRRAGGPWRAKTIFEDRDRGHWLAVAELDGRNATDEILGSGYGGRIFLLARPPGFGVDEEGELP